MGMSMSMGMALAVFTAPATAHEPASPAAQTGAMAADLLAHDAAAAVDAFHAALSEGDQRAAAEYLSDEALIFEGGGVERSKAEYASHHLPADAAFAGATTRTVTRRVGHAIDDLAWIASEAKTTGTYKGQPINSVSTETMVLRRTDAGWRIVHIHWSSAKVD